MAIDPDNLSDTAVLTFADEFNGNALDLSKWGTAYPWDDITGGLGNETGNTNTLNGEAQWYVDAEYAGLQHLDTYRVADGVLTITARPADEATSALIEGYDYTSGMINTRWNFSQTYGYFEMRADLPDGTGVWPAFWLLPQGGDWPPEIDIMEVGIGEDRADGLVNSIHSTGPDGETVITYNETVVEGLSSGGFHTFGLDWQPGRLTWYLDGEAVHSLEPPDGFDQPMFLLANLALGGLSDPPDGSANQLVIDYIRAYAERPTGEWPDIGVPEQPSLPEVPEAPTAPRSPTAPQPPEPPELSLACCSRHGEYFLL